MIDLTRALKYPFSGPDALTQIVAAVGATTICLVSAYIQFINFAAVSHLNGQWGAVLKKNRRKPSVIRPIKPLTR